MEIALKRIAKLCDIMEPTWRNLLSIKLKDTRTPQQKAALKVLIEQLKEEYPEATVHGHNEFAAKACPCFDVKEEFG